MDFFISGRVTQDVSPEYRLLTKELNAEIRRMLPSAQLHSLLTSIIVFPTILNPDIATMPDDVKFKSGEKSVFVSVNIPHGSWMSASKIERIKLLTDNVNESVNRIEESLLPSEDRTTLLVFIQQGAHVLIQKHQN